MGSSTPASVSSSTSARPPQRARATWTAFLDSLYRRGLTGDNLELVSIRWVCWSASCPRCGLSLRVKAVVLGTEDAQRGYQAAAQASGRLHGRGQDHLPGPHPPRGRPAPNAVRCIEDVLDELLPFLDCPQVHWKKVRTISAIERTFREVRRRTRPMSCCQNSASVERLLFGVISHMNANWKAKPLPKFAHNS